MSIDECHPESANRRMKDLIYYEILHFVQNDNK